MKKHQNRTATVRKLRPAGRLHKTIKDAASKQIAASGAPSLSLRAVARSLGITAPAIYNYYRRRDELITALIVDAYTDFGASQSAALRSAAPAGHASRLRALGLAYRDWAVANPARYQLMFGAPYPGYRLPAETVGPVAGRALSVLVGVLEQACLAGELRLDASAPPAGLALERAGELYGSANPRVLHAALAIWGRVHGLVAIELSRQYPPFVSEPQQVYRGELDALVNSYLRRS